MNNVIQVTVEVLVHVSIEKAWAVYTQPEFITQWNHASDDWHSPRAENDLCVGGKFKYRMEVKDGSGGFDFEGVYTDVKLFEHIAYTIGNRVADVSFSKSGGDTKVTVVFDAENENPIEMQRGGWQAILDNYKKCTEQS